MKIIWILVRTSRGSFYDPEIFINKKEAELRMKEIKQTDFNIDYDAIELFKKSIFLK